MKSFSESLPSTGSPDNHYNHSNVSLLTMKINIYWLLFHLKESIKIDSTDRSEKGHGVDHTTKTQPNAAHAKSSTVDHQSSERHIILAVAVGCATIKIFLLNHI